MKRRAYLVIVCSLSSVTGCLEASNSQTGKDTEAQVTTVTSSEDIEAYRDLSERGQQVFKRLLDEESLTGASSDFPSDLWKADYIKYKGTVYAIKREQTFRSISEHQLKTEFVNEASIETDSDVIAFEQLSEEAQEAFEIARQNGICESRKPLPDQLIEYGYVRYNMDYYKLQQIDGDIPEWKLSVVKLNSDK